MLQIMLYGYNCRLAFLNRYFLAHYGILCCMDIIVGTPPYVPDVTSAVDTSNFDVDDSDFRPNVRAQCFVQIFYYYTCYK